MLIWVFVRELVPFKLLQVLCHCCWQELQTITQSSPSDDAPQGQHDFFTFLDFEAGALELVESLSGLFFEDTDVGLGL